MKNDKILYLQQLLYESYLFKSVFNLYSQNDNSFVKTSITYISVNLGCSDRKNLTELSSGDLLFLNVI